MLVLHSLVIHFALEAVLGSATNDGENYESDDLRSYHSTHTSGG